MIDKEGERPRKPWAQAVGISAGYPFSDLPGAGDLDWLGV